MKNISNYQELFGWIVEQMQPAGYDVVCKKLGISTKTYYNILNRGSISIKTKQILIDFAKSKGYVVKDNKGNLSMTKMTSESPEMHELLAEINENVKYLISVVLKK